MQQAQQETLWVLRAQTGDRGAMDQLFLAIQNPLYRFLRSLGADAHGAEDLLQEVFMTIYKKIRWLREPRLFRAWSYRIAHRLAARRLASEQREQDRCETAAEIEVPSPDSELPALAASDLSELLVHVSAKSRAVLALHFEHGLELAEIADVLELPVGTVKSRLGHGLATLRKRLGGPDSRTAAGATP